MVCVRITGRSGSLVMVGRGGAGGAGGGLGAVVTGGGGAVATVNSGTMATGGGGFTRSGGGGGGAFGISFWVSTVALISSSCLISAPWLKATTIRRSPKTGTAHGRAMLGYRLRARVRQALR